MNTPLYYAQDRLLYYPFSLNQKQLEPKVWTPLVLGLWNFRYYTTRSCLVISVKTIVNAVPLQKSYQETLNQYLHNILNRHSIQFLKLSVQNIEENVTSRDAMFRLQRDDSSAYFSIGCDITFCWMILIQKKWEALYESSSAPSPPR